MDKLINKNDIYRISNKVLNIIIPELLKLIRNQSGSAVNLKNRTLGSFKRAMNTFKTTIIQTESKIKIRGEIGLDKFFSQFDKTRGGQKTNLFEIYDRSDGKQYTIRAKNKYLRFKFENFSPRNPDLKFIKIKNGFMREEADGWYVYVTEVRRIAFKGFKTFQQEEKFNKMYAELVISEINIVVSNSIDGMLIRKVKNIRKK